MHAQAVLDQRPLLYRLLIYGTNFEFQSWWSKGLKIFCSREKVEYLCQRTRNLLLKRQNVGPIRHQDTFIPLKHTGRVGNERHLSH